MKVSRVRLTLAAILFAGWIGWLAYLVFQSRNPVILSRPQFLVADLWVIAEVSQKGHSPDENVTVQIARTTFPATCRPWLSSSAFFASSSGRTT